MRRRKIIKVFVLLTIVGIIGAVSIGVYLFNKPHRDVEAAPIEFRVSNTDLVSQYLTNPEQANQKYLDDGGNSSILAVTGKVHSVSRDMNNQAVVLLKDEEQKAGVSCTFTLQTSDQAEKLQVGQSITVKGVIRAGAGYDEDLGLYEDVILEKCSIL